MYMLCCSYMAMRQNPVITRANQSFWLWMLIPAKIMVLIGTDPSPVSYT